MSIKSPTTYSDWYWKNSVEAKTFYDDESEKVIVPFVAGILNDIPDLELLPPGMQSFISALKSPPSFAFLPFLSGVGLNAVDEILDTSFEGFYKAIERKKRSVDRSTWLTSDEVNILWTRKKITEGLWNEVTASEGYEDILASSKYESQLPYPSIPDIILYSRYRGQTENPWTEFQEWYNISPRDWKIWEWQTLQRMTTIDVGTLFRRGKLNDNEYYNELLQIGWTRDNIEEMKEVGWTIPNAMLLVQGNLLNDVDEDQIIADISHADIHPDFARTYLDGILTKPATGDLISYLLRMDPDMPDLDRQLRRLGVHSSYTDVYKTLAYPIPPVSDIITMAVREAFTPAIAERFGQYEDFPPDFEKYAAQKGLTKEWSLRYWAAHWNLPSPSQGFDMLHRGVIDVDTLNMLLRAQDVMPYWRDKLVAIAYRPLTRVDVRRMYKEGVLDEGEVYESYLIAGYNEQNAERMAKFTVAQTLSVLSKFTSGDVVKAYVARMITKSEASSLLRDMNIRSEDSSYILSTADYKREWELTDNKISGIKNLYKKQVYDENMTIDKLSSLNLPSEQVNVLMEQWYYEVKAEVTATWTTAQTLGFLKKKVITKDRAIKELQLNGYDEEHIQVYLYEPPEQEA